MQCSLKAALLLPLLVVAATPAKATLVTPMSLEQMTDQAHWIGIGTCTSVHSAWESKQIWTEAVFKMERTLKGGSPTELRVRQLGGRVSEPVPVAMRVPGVQDFRVGEINLLFLERGVDGTPRVLGLMQGRVPLSRDDKGALRGPGGEAVESILSQVEARLKAGAKP